MVNTEDITRLAQAYLTASTCFLVGVKVSAENDIEVCIDGPDGISLGDCVALSKAIEAGLDREREDFSLTVTSSGLDQPLKVFPQYLKYLNRQVEVVLHNGQKFKATLLEATPEEIVLAWSALEAVEGKKRKQKVERGGRFTLQEIKTTKPVI